MVLSAANAAEIFLRVAALSIAVTGVVFLATWLVTSKTSIGCAASRYLAWLSLGALCAAIPLFGFAGAFSHRYVESVPIVKTAAVSAVTAQHGSAVSDFPILGTDDATPVNLIEPTIHARRTLTLSQLLSIFWTVGTLLLLTRIAVRLRAALTLKRGTRYWPRERAARYADVVFSDEVGSPVAIGYLRPAIVLPSELQDEAYEAVREHALAHENAHLRRYDDYTALLYQICIALAWWNPVVWLVSTHLSAEREKACDDAVVLETRAAKEYGLSLISLCRGTRFTRRDHVLALFEARERLADRIEAIVSVRPRSVQPRIGAALFCAFLALLQGGFAVSFTPGFALAASAQVIDLPALSQPRAAHVAALLHDGQVLIAGGLTQNGTYLRSAELYDPRTRRFTPVQNLHDPRAGAAYVVLSSGEVLIAGGWTTRGVTRSTEIYEPWTRTFRSGPPLLEARAGETATLLRDGRVLLAGGETLGGSVTNCAEIYVPQDNAFIEGGTMYDARVSHTATLLRDGTVLLAGGTSEENDALSSAEIYDPVVRQFQSIAPMNTARTKQSATLLADGRVLIAGGGSDYSWQHVQRSAEIFDPSTRTFARIADMNDARFKDADATVALADGSVLFAGGSSGIERFDAHKMRFTLLDGHSKLARHSGTATLLHDGSVLLAGGYGDNARTSASSQLVFLR